MGLKRVGLPSTAERMDEGRNYSSFLPAPHCPQAQVALQSDKLLSLQPQRQADLKTPRAETASTFHSQRKECETLPRKFSLSPPPTLDYAGAQSFFSFFLRKLFFKGNLKRSHTQGVYANPPRSRETCAKTVEICTLIIK